MQKLVELPGGNLTVESKPGEGSIFSFSLQIHTDASKPISPRILHRVDAISPDIGLYLTPQPFDEIKLSAGSVSFPHLLIVDDDSAIFNVLSNYFSNQSYKISGAAGAWIRDIKIHPWIGYDITRLSHESGTVPPPISEPLFVQSSKKKL